METICDKNAVRPKQAGETSTKSCSSSKRRKVCTVEEGNEKKLFTFNSESVLSIPGSNVENLPNQSKLGIKDSKKLPQNQKFKTRYKYIGTESKAYHGKVCSHRTDRKDVGGQNLGPSKYLAFLESQRLVNRLTLSPAGVLLGRGSTVTTAIMY